MIPKNNRPVQFGSRGLVMGAARFFTCLCAGAILVVPCRATAADNPPPLQLVVEVSDGSRIIGTPHADQFKLTTNYAEMQISYSRVVSIQLGAGGAASLNLQNGDQLSGRLAGDEIAIKAAFGELKIPMDKVKRIKVNGPGDILPDGLVLHYSFDQDEGVRVTDASEAGSHGTVRGCTYTTEGKRGGAMRFTGEGQAILIANPVKLELQDFTIMEWIKRSDVEISAGIKQMGGVGLFGFGQSGYLLGLVSDGRLFLSAVGIGGVYSQSKINDNAFHQVVLTRKGSRVVFYLDGKADPACVYDTHFEFNSDAAVGARADNVSQTFLGVIDEVAVFNRELSADEIKRIFDSQK